MHLQTRPGGDSVLNAGAGVRVVLALAVVALFVIAGILASRPGPPGWQGSDVHLVDHVWIGAEMPCGSTDSDEDMTCRLIVRSGVSIGEQQGWTVDTATFARLPTSFFMTTGEGRTARLQVGVLTHEAVVVALRDGTRRVVGMLCEVARAAGASGPTLLVNCEPGPLDDWIDGHVPPSYPPGAVFG
jgi:hypothetical protein